MVSASSVPGAEESDGAVISVGATGGGASSAMPGLAANSATAQKIQTMRFIRFLPVPWSSFIVFPGRTAGTRPAACTTA